MFNKPAPAPVIIATRPSNLKLSILYFVVSILNYKNQYKLNYFYKIGKKEEYLM